MNEEMNGWMDGWINEYADVQKDVGRVGSKNIYSSYFSARQLEAK